MLGVDSQMFVSVQLRVDRAGEIRQPERGRHAEVWIPITAQAA
jgi:hypothetical protein